MACYTPLVLPGPLVSQKLVAPPGLGTISTTSMRSGMARGRGSLIPGPFYWSGICQRER